MPSATVELVSRAAIWWLDHKPFSKEARARRKAKRAARKSGQDAPVESVEKPMLKGKKTYLGILAAGLGLVLGWVGVGEVDASTLSAQFVAALDQILTVGGLLFAAYGRANAKP